MSQILLPPLAVPPSLSLQLSHLRPMAWWGPRLGFTGPNSIRKINSAFILRFNEKGQRISRVLLCFVFFRKVSLSWKEAWRSRLATSQKKEETDMLHYSCSHIMLE